MTAYFTHMENMVGALTTMVKNMAPQPAPPLALPIINVLPAQTETKKANVLKVQAIIQLFDPPMRALAWKETEVDHAGVTQAYDMDRAAERVREIVAKRFGHSSTKAPPLKFLTNVSLLLFDYGSEALSIEDFNVKSQRIGDSWERFTEAFLHMRHVLAEYVSLELGAALDTLFMSLTDIKVKYSRIRTSSITHLVQKMMGRLRTLPQFPRPTLLTVAIKELLQLSETSPAFQEIINMEAVGTPEVAPGSRGKRGTDSQGTSPPDPTKRAKPGVKPTRPPLQGAYPCYSWIKGLSCCAGTVCGAAKRRGVHPHEFDPADKGAPEAAFRAWVKKYM
jgi:hypothetical protein